MPSIAEATRARRSRERPRLVAGLGLVLAGALLVGLGAAGTVSGATAKASLTLGGLAVVLSLGLLAVRAPLCGPERALAAAGAAVSLAALLVAWVLTPAAVLAEPALTTVVGLGYAAGLTVVLAAVLAGVTMDRGGQPRGSEPSPVAWTRSVRGPRTRSQAADGGATDEELAFPSDER